MTSRPQFMHTPAQSVPWCSDLHMVTPRDLEPREHVYMDLTQLPAPLASVEIPVTWCDPIDPAVVPTQRWHQ